MIRQRSLVKLIFLSLITFGIYAIVFWRGYIKDINDACVCDGKKSPNLSVVALLSFLTCGLYYLIWLFIQGERLRTIAPEYGLSFKEGGSAVLLYNIGGSIVMSFSSFISFIVSFLSGFVSSLSIIESSIGAINPTYVDTLKSIGTPLMLNFLLFCSFSLFVLSISLTFKSMNILIHNLNKIGKVYNEKCI